MGNSGRAIIATTLALSTFITQGAEAVRKIGIVTLKTGKVRYLKVPGDYAEVEQWLSKR